MNDFDLKREHWESYDNSAWIGFFFLFPLCLKLALSKRINNCNVIFLSWILAVITPYGFVCTEMMWVIILIIHLFFIYWFTEVACLFFRCLLFCSWNTLYRLGSWFSLLPLPPVGRVQASAIMPSWSMILRKITKHFFWVFDTQGSYYIYRLSSIVKSNWGTCQKQQSIPLFGLFLSTWTSLPHPLRRRTPIWWVILGGGRFQLFPTKELHGYFYILKCSF